MKTATLVVSSYFQNNRIFDANPAVNRDGANSAYVTLQKAFATHGVTLATNDIHPPEASDYILYLDIPPTLPKPEHVAKSFLIIGEVEVVMPANWNREKHKSFAKIFTFCDDVVDNKHYFKLNSSRAFHSNVPVNPAEKTKFCTLIASNKSSSHPQELYSKRVEAIRWFEANNPSQFDLYGMGWNKKVFTGLLRPLNRIPHLPQLLAPRFPSYRGTVENKFNVLRHYKFAVSFENAQGINGYITGDKIFDPMQAGSIPIYWGAPNITKYVPAECFIDFRKFNCSWSNLYPYIANLSTAEHKKYLSNINNFISNKAITGPYSDTAFAQTLVQHVLGRSKPAH